MARQLDEKQFKIIQTKKLHIILLEMDFSMLTKVAFNCIRTGQEICIRVNGNFQKHCMTAKSEQNDATIILAKIFPLKIQRKSDLENFTKATPKDVTWLESLNVDI